MANNCQLWLTTIVLTAIVLCNSFSVEAGKKKDKGLIIVLSNGGCGGNIVVQTAKDGKKGGGGHKIVVKGGDSGGGCGCSNSCGSCGGGGDHHHVQHVPVPVPVPPGHPIPPMGHPDMHAAMMSQLVPAYSADDPHQSSGSSGDSDQDTQASDSATSATSSDDMSKDSTDSSSDSNSSSASEKAKMVAPLFIPMNAITPPWFHGSPVFMDPSSQNHLSSTIKNMPNRFPSSSPSASQSESNYQQNGEKGEFAQSSNVAPTFNDPIFNLHGLGSNFMAPPMGYQGFDENPLLTQSLPTENSNKKDPSDANKSQGSRGGRSGYLQPLIDSVQRLLRGPGPLREIEQGLVRQGQRMQASFSNLVPIAITNYTSYLPSLPGLRSSSGNRDRKPTTNRRSRYLESLRVRLRPLTTMEGNRLAPFIENLWKNIRGRGSTGTSPIESASTTNQVKSQELNNNLPGTSGHHVLPIDPANGHHPHHHFNIPGQQNNQVMQQYLEQILTSKWWEWPTGGLLGPNLNQY